MNQSGSPAPQTTRAPTNISPQPTGMIDVICWLRMIAATTTVFADFRSAMMRASWALAYAKKQL
ncbi:MAG: hypothetical protein C5S49_05285 [Candidatus Methanogaster sp.]|nr:MAG: hypothetical protein C5S49_05285 [ANME-2 cluster archaeon]